MYEYEASVVRVIDGDTIVVDVDLGLSTWVRNVHLRLSGIDCPELGTPEGEAAKAAAVDWCSKNKMRVRIKTEKDHTEKYGRYLATILPIGYTDILYSLNSVLLQAGHAELYDGGLRG